MYFARLSVTIFCFAAIVGASYNVPCARAQEAEAASSDRRDAARRLFEQGERAFDAGDFVLAAKSFDEAYRNMPHYAPLWNAARSWERAGEPTRAANGYTKYLRLAPDDAPDRDAATAALGALAEKLGRIEVYAAEVDVVRVDNESIEGTSVYVHPGMHVIEGQTGETKIQRTEVVEAGSVRSVVLVEKPEPILRDAPAPESIVQTSVPTVSKPHSGAQSNTFPPKNRAQGWLGSAAIAAGGVTVGAASLVLWSGMDTLAAKEEFDAAPTEEKLAAGKDKQFRTNAILGGAIGSAVVTAALISLWKWNGSTTKTAISVLPPVAGMPLQFGVMGSF